MDIFDRLTGRDNDKTGSAEAGAMSEAAEQAAAAAVEALEGATYRWGGEDEALLEDVELAGDGTVVDVTFNGTRYQYTSTPEDHGGRIIAAFVDAGFADPRGDPAVGVKYVGTEVHLQLRYED